MIFQEQLKDITKSKYNFVKTFDVRHGDKCYRASQGITGLWKMQRGSCMVWEINMGVCPRLEFDNIMFINCLGYDFYIYGAFEFLCNFIANL